nr:YopT-type cysteine protease domain-containing protein [uncultured Pseudomonas sp.]
MPIVKWFRPWSNKPDLRAEFKQSEYVANNSIASSGGVCAGASLTWLKRLLENPAESENGRVAYLSSGDQWIPIKKRHVEYNEIAHSIENRIRKGLPNICQRQAGRSASASGLQNLGVLDNFIRISQPSHYVLEFSFELPEWASPMERQWHTCAFHVAGGQLRFFDPNFGEFVVRENISSFMQKHNERYSTYASTETTYPLTIDQMVVVQVAR